MNRYFVVLILLVAMMACKQTEAKKDNSVKVEQTQAKGDLPDLPPPPQEFLVEMQKKTHTIDYLFRHTNFSINQTGDEQVLPIIGLMGLSPVPNRSSACKAPLRMTFVGDDGIICDTEMYITPDCEYQEFLVNGKPVYASLLTTQCKNYIQNLMKQAKSVRPPGQ